MRRYLDKLWAVMTVFFFIAWTAQLYEIRHLKAGLDARDVQLRQAAEQRLEQMRADVVRELRESTATQRTVADGMRQQVQAFEASTQAIVDICTGRRDAAPS